MKNWLKFIMIPIIIIWVLELLASFIVGGIFESTSNSFLGLVSSFIIYFFGGAAIYQLSPVSNKIVFSVVFAIFYIGFGLYLGIITDGNVTKIMGERVVQEFLVFPEIIKTAGMFLAILGAHKNETDANQVKASI
ncbi:MAG: hypothetical protein ACI8WB_002160 [Phenylobacterium sp.]|jgi:hypothetical protein